MSSPPNRTWDSPFNYASNCRTKGQADRCEMSSHVSKACFVPSFVGTITHALCKSSWQCLRTYQSQSISIGRERRKKGGTAGGRKGERERNRGEREREREREGRNKEKREKEREEGEREKREFFSYSNSPSFFCITWENGLSCGRMKKRPVFIFFIFDSEGSWAEWW